MVTHLEDEFSLIRLAQYFIHLRLEKARCLLRETNRRVIEIGLEVGYTSASHFAQIFCREVGISPSEYRRLT
jgi:AraC family transcriptional regulator